MRKAKFLFLVSLFLCVVVLNSEVAPAFATTIFSSGWENSGGTDPTDGGAWTGTIVGGGASLTVESLNPHHGTYNAKTSLPASSTAVYGLVYRTISAQTTINVRQYFKYSTNPDIGYQFYVLRIDAIGEVARVYVYVINDAGTIKWKLRYYAGGTYYEATSTTNAPQPNTWFAVEVRYVVSSTSGEARLYINGDEIITQTGLNTGTSAITFVKCGAAASPLSPAINVYFDCVVVADTYIGPEGAQYSASASQTVSFALSTAATQTLNRAGTQTLSLSLTANVLQTLSRTSSLSVAFSAVSSTLSTFYRSATQPVTFTFGATAELTAALVRYASLTLTFTSETSKLFMATRNPILNIPLQLTTGKAGNFLRTAIQSLSFLWQSIAYVPGLVERAASLMITFTSGTVGFWVNPYYASKGFVFAVGLFVVFVFVLPAALILLRRR